MAIEAARIVIPIDTNADRASASMRKLDQSTSQSAKSADGATRAFQALKNLGIAALALRAARAIGEFAREVVNLASDAAETQQKFSVTFRGIQDDANAAATALARDFGLAQSQAQQLLADTGDLLTGFGFTREEALSLSTQVQTLAVDLASFSNFAGGAEGASQALTKALLGERESVKALGIAITEADIQRLAEEKGIVGELTRQEKAALTLELAVRQSANAIGDFERSQASFANQVRIAEARIQDQKTAIGNALLPFANLAVTTFNNLGSGVATAVDNINEFIRSAEGATQIGRIFGQIAGAVSVLSEAYKVIIAQLRDSLQPAFEQIRSVLASFRGEGENTGVVFTILGNVLQGIVAGVAIFGVSLNATITNIRNFVEAVRASAQAVGQAFRIFNREVSFQDVRASFEEAGNAFRNFGSGVVQGYGQIFQEVREQVGSFTDGAEANTQRLLETFQRTAESVGQTVATALQASTDGVIDASAEAEAAAADAAAEAQRLADEQARAAAALAEERAAFEEQFTIELLRQSGDRIAIIERERQEALAEAERLGADRLAVETFYAEEIRRVRVEEAEKAAEEMRRIEQENSDALLESFAEMAEASKRRVESEFEDLRALGDARRAAAAGQLEAAQAAAEKEIEIAKAVSQAKQDLFASTFDLFRQLIKTSIKDDRKRAIAEKALSAVQAGINTALAITKALSVDPTGALAIIVGALGAVQVGTILATPIPAAQFGGSFQVPPGNNGDSGLVRVNSGEQVDISPARQSGGGMPERVTLYIGGEAFDARVASAFNRGSAQIRRASAIRTK